MLTAKLVSLKARQLKQDPVVYQKQSTVLHSQLQEPAFADSQIPFFEQGKKQGSPHSLLRCLDESKLGKTQSKFQTQSQFFQTKSDLQKGFGKTVPGSLPYLVVFGDEHREAEAAADPGRAGAEPVQDAAVPVRPGADESDHGPPGLRRQRAAQNQVLGYVWCSNYTL